MTLVVNTFLIRIFDEFFKGHPYNVCIDASDCPGDKLYNGKGGLENAHFRLHFFGEEHRDQDQRNDNSHEQRFDDAAGKHGYGQTEISFYFV